MSSDKSRTHIWLRIETFVYGALPIPPHPRLSLHNILKIIPYVKSKKGSNNYPNITYALWRTIALHKLQLPEDLAWMYFSTFDTINDSSTSENRINLDERLSYCKNDKEIEMIRETVSVPLLKFTIFLYLQHFHKISLRESLNYVEWPSDTSESSQHNLREKSFNEQSHISFMQNKLKEILTLLAEPSPNQQDLYLTMESIEALNILFMGSLDNMRHETSLNTTVFAHSSELSSSNSRLYKLKLLQNWLLDHLTTSPFGVTRCISSGRQLTWNHVAGRDIKAAGDSSSRPPRKFGRVVTNATSIPSDSTPGNKIMIISHVSKQVIARRASATLEGSAVKIHRCHHSTVYLLAPLRSVSVEKCRHTTIVLGAVETTLHMQQCDNVTVIAPCRRFTAAANSMCTVHLLTPNRPLVLTGNERLRFAPFNTNYPLLEQHIYNVGLSSSPNLWDRPLVLGPPVPMSPATPPWFLLPPDEYLQLVIPYDDYHTDEMLYEVPALYRKSIEQTRHKHLKFNALFEDANLTKEQKYDVLELLNNEFANWCRDNHHIRNLQSANIVNI